MDKDFNEGLIIGLASGESLDNLVVYRGRLDLKDRVTTSVYINKVSYYKDDLKVGESNIIDIDLKDSVVKEESKVIDVKYEEKVVIDKGTLK